MDGDVALRENRDAGHAIRLKMMHMDVQKRRASGLDAASQRLFDVADVVKPLCIVKVDDQMHAGAAYAVTNGEMSRTIPQRYRRRHF